MSVKKRNHLILLGVLVIALVVGIYLFYSLVITANRTTSPDGERWASFNRITNVTIVENNSGDVQLGWRIGGLENPVFLWSPNSRFLAITSTAADGNRRAEIMDTELNNSTMIPTELDIQTIEKLPDSNPQIDGIEWHDNDNVLVQFTYPADEYGQIISGSFLFEFSNYTIRYLTYNRITASP